MEGMRLFRRTRGLVINEKDALNVTRQTVGVHSTYGDKDNANVDDVTANNKGKSIVIPDDIKGDYVKCLIILLYPMDASLFSCPAFLPRNSHDGDRLFENYACLVVIKSF